MASGILGQVAPAASTWTELYTVPMNTLASLRVIVANRGSTETHFIIAAEPAGAPAPAAPPNESHIASGTPGEGIQGNTSGSSIAFLAQAGVVVKVFALNSNLSFTASGEERTV